MPDLTIRDDAFELFDEELDFADEIGNVPIMRNPASLTWPPTLPVEIALKTAPLESIRNSYGYSVEEWHALRDHPTFIKDLTRAVEMVKEEGMSFRMKAALQAEELLKTSWQMIHSADTAAAVRADLLKFTIRAAGLDGSRDRTDAGPGVAMQINIDLGGKI